MVLLGVPGSDVVIELYVISGVEKHPASARPCDPANGHICFYVADLDALYARLVACGHESGAGRVIALPPGSAAGADGKVVYMVYPDGFHVELYERPPAVSAD